MILFRIKYSPDQNGHFTEIDFNVYDQDSNDPERFNQHRKLEDKFFNIITNLLDKHDLEWDEPIGRYTSRKIKLKYESKELIAATFILMRNVDTTIDDVVSQITNKHPYEYEERIKNEDIKEFLNLFSNISGIKPRRIKKFKDLYE